MLKRRIFIVDDHRIVREGLQSLVEKENDLEVVGMAENGRQALLLARRLKPDVVIMDIAMPELNGVDATRQILDEVPGVKVIALSMHSEKQFVEGMLRAGVMGYLLKESAFEELIKAIRIVCAGKKYLSPDVTDIVLRDYLSPPDGKDIEQASDLTLREREVLQLLAEGRATKKIAERLNISVKTVESHRKNLMDKLNLHTVAELTKYAVRRGLTSIE
ncbi:MAG: response regulator transcription factor [Desulfobacterales bacterium]